jgi:hypothetical protein
MALRLLLAAFGLLELLAPRKFVDAMMDLAVTADSDVELRSWVYTVARIEGLLILLWALSSRGDGATE